MLVEWKWVLMKEDGTLVEGKGSQKQFVAAAKTPGIVDGDVSWDGSNYYKKLDWFDWLLKKP